MIHRIQIIALVCAALVLPRCSSVQPVVTGGTGSETVIGTIVHKDGTLASNTTVILIKADFDPAAGLPQAGLLSDTTDSLGNYALRAPDTGAYNIQAVHNTERTRLLIRNVHVNQDTVFSPEATLRQPGSLAIVPHAAYNGEIGYFYIPGTTFFSSRPDGFGNILLDSIPAGVALTVCYEEPGNTMPPLIIRNDITVVSGQTTVTDYAAWLYSREVILNTTASGADVSLDVYDFPVLIRLTDTNFDFSQARTGGADLRFAKKDNTPLSHEIERWDSAAGQAEVWVRIDTVLANNETQSFTMYWGNSAASGFSRGVTVFDTTRGFEGIWHFNGSYEDVTVNARHGTSNGTTLVDAVIGEGCLFEGDSPSIALPPLWSPAPTGVTISSWVNIDSLTAAQRFLVYHGQYGEVEFGLKLDSLTLAVKTGTQAAGDTVWTRLSSEPGLSAGKWLHVCGTWRKGDVMKLYIDGVQRAVVNATAQDLYDPGAQWQTSLAAYNRGTRYDFFTGLMDECRVESRARSLSWVRLNYMNQRPDGDRLVSFK